MEPGHRLYEDQWGGVWKKRNGRQLEDRTWDELPSRRRTADANGLSA